MLELRATTPKVGGWFHLFFWVLSVTAGVLLCRRLKDGEIYAPRVVVSTAVLVILLEIYKIYHFGLIRGKGTFAFPWQYFPFQFCSTPMYIGVEQNWKGKYCHGKAKVPFPRIKPKW